MRLRFTIRDLLWLTAFAAMGFGWWSDRHAIIAKHEAVEDALRTDFNSFRDTYSKVRKDILNKDARLRNGDHDIRLMPLPQVPAPMAKP